MTSQTSLFCFSKKPIGCEAFFISGNGEQHEECIKSFFFLPWRGRNNQIAQKKGHLTWNSKLDTEPGWTNGKKESKHVLSF